MKKATKGAKSTARARAKAPSPTSEPVAARVKKLCATLLRDAALAPSVRQFQASTQSGAPRKFGSNGLKVKGKLFALFTQDTLVVKLPKARVAELCAAGQGEPFDPGHGRLMKEWLTVTSEKASWPALAREAFRFVSGVSD